MTSDHSPTSPAPDLTDCPFCAQPCEHEIEGDEDHGYAVTITADHLGSCPFSASHETGAVNGVSYSFETTEEMIAFLTNWNRRPAPGDKGKLTAGLDLEACERFMAGPWSHPEPNLRPTALALCAEVRRLRSIPAPAPLAPGFLDNHRLIIVLDKSGSIRTTGTASERDWMDVLKEVKSNLPQPSPTKGATP